MGITIAATQIQGDFQQTDEHKDFKKQTAGLETRNTT